MVSRQSLGLRPLYSMKVISCQSRAGRADVHQGLERHLADVYTGAYSNADADTYFNADADTNAYSDADAYFNADADTNTYSNTDAYADSNNKYLPCSLIGDSECDSAFFRAVWSSGDSIRISLGVPQEFRTRHAHLPCFFQGPELPDSLGFRERSPRRDELGLSVILSPPASLSSPTPSHWSSQSHSGSGRRAFAWGTKRKALTGRLDRVASERTNPP